FEFTLAIKHAKIAESQGECDQTNCIGVGITRAEIEIVEGRQIGLPRQRSRRRSGTPGRQHIDDIEGAHRRYRLEEEYNQEWLCDPWQRDVAEVLKRASTIDTSSIVKLCRYPLQCCEQQDHCEWHRVPHVRPNESQQCRCRVRQPATVFADQPQADE